jgi:D-beta-D-heptose 7-phosphate kinase/D-beta-D-heptose 1-phosphate adenosyltransferase
MTELNTQQPKQYKILLLGDDCTDVYKYGTVDRISPEAPVPVFKFSYQITKPGMAGNVSENLKKLGCDVNFL